MKILVTGGAGFIGSWVADFLLKEGHEVAIVDDLSSGSKNNINENVKFYERDIRDNLDDIFSQERPDYVYHLAAQINVRKSIEDPKEDADINIVGILNVLSYCVEYKIKKIIFSSSGGAIYGNTLNVPTSENEKENPISPYGISKWAIERYLRFYKEIYNLDYVALRYSNVYGPRQNSRGEAGVISLFFRNLIENKESTIFGSGNQTRDYVYVKDVAQANVKALNLSGVYNVGMGVEISVNELYTMMGEVSGIQGKKTQGKKIEGEIERSALDASKIRKEGWIPQYNLQTALKETFDFVKNN